MGQDPIRGDQALEHLRQENARLRKALESIDRAVDRAAAKYLKKRVEHGFLTFEKFLDLLVREVHRDLYEALTDRHKFREIMSKEVADMINRQFLEMLPKIKDDVKALLPIQVVVLPDKSKVREDGQFTRTGIRAQPIYGHVRGGFGATVEEAVRDMAHNLAIALVSIQGNRDRLLTFFKTFDRGMRNRFYAATPYQTMDVAGLPVEIRVESTVRREGISA